MRFKKIVSNFMLSSLLMAASLGVYASSDAAVDLAAALASVDTMTGSFEQRISDAKGEAVQVSEGQFKIKRPGQFFWHVAPPYEQVVVGTTTGLKVYDPDLEQMTVHGQDALAGTPAALISGDGTKIAEHYLVTKTQDKKNIRFELKQKKGGNGAFASLHLIFASKNKQQHLVQMIFVDKLDQRTEVTLSKVKINPAIADADFRFDPPKDTDIIIDG